jgi:hypothetical protein
VEKAQVAALFDRPSRRCTESNARNQDAARDPPAARAGLTRLLAGFPARRVLCSSRRSRKQNAQ